MFLLCPKHEDIKSIGNNTHIWRENMRKRMYLQLFEDGTGAGSNGQGGNNAGHRQKRLHKREQNVQKDQL